MADLITLEDYKTYKGMTKNDKDGQIAFIISAVSSLIKTYCGHSIIDNWDIPLVEDISTPFDQHNIYLNGYPVREIISVEETTPDGTIVGGLDSTVSWEITHTGSLFRRGRTWERNVRVTYTTGYAEVPFDLKLATIELVSYYLNEEWKAARALQGTSIGAPPPTEDGIPKHIQFILDSYKVN